MKQLLVRALPICAFLLFTTAFHLSAQDVKVVKTFITQYDNVNIDITKGTVSYKLFVRNTVNSRYPTRPNDSATDVKPTPDSTKDITISQPGSYEIKLEVTMDCDTCAAVTFR